MSRGRANNPKTRLCAELRAAAAHISLRVYREKAAREAASIGQLGCEKWPSSQKGKVAALARATMKRLPDLPPEEFSDCAAALRAMADALAGDGVLAVETKEGVAA